MSSSKIIFKTETNGYYLLEIRDKKSYHLIFSDALKSNNKKIIIKGFTKELFAFALKPILTTNHWEKTLLS